MVEPFLYFYNRLSLFVVMQRIMAVTRRFPFSIFYTIEPDEIIIHSVFDNRQDPKKKPK